MKNEGRRRGRETKREEYSVQIGRFLSRATLKASSPQGNQSTGLWAKKKQKRSRKKREELKEAERREKREKLREETERMGE